MLTGQQYKDSLKDGRVVYYMGERIEDLGSVPALAAPLNEIAAGYDKYYDPAPDAINPVTMAPRSPEELRERVPIITDMDLLTNTTYQSLMTLSVAAARLEDSVPEVVPRIRAYVEQARKDDIRITECITDAKGNRVLPPSKQEDPDAYVRVVERRSDGVVIRGAKLHISAAAFGHELMVMPTKAMSPGEEDYSIAACIPANSPGIHMTNTTYHPVGRDERDFPTSSRKSIPDSMVIFDDVFVPEDRIFLDGQTEFSSVFAHTLGLWERLGGVSFMVEQADELVGFALLIAEANGTSRVSHVREKIDEMMIHATLVRAGLEAALVHAEATPEGYYYPDDLFTNVAKYQGAINFSQMVRNLHDIAGGAIVTAPSMADFDNEELGPFVEKYMSTGSGITGEYRTRLFHAIRDTTADSFGGWHHVTNLQSGGGMAAQRLVTRKHYDADRAKALALKAAGLLEDPND